MKVKIGKCSTKIDTIDKFVEHTLDSDTLGCDREFIRTNMFNANESLLLAHGWNTDIAPISFRNFCKNGREYLQDPQNHPLMVTWQLLYDKYRAHMFFQHYKNVYDTQWKLARDYNIIPCDIVCETEFIRSDINGDTHELYTECLITNELYTECLITMECVSRMLGNKEDK